jgi:hypothetical protein
LLRTQSHRIFLIWISRQQDVYWVGLSTPLPTPNLEDQASVFVTTGDRVTLRHLVPILVAFYDKHEIRCDYFTISISYFLHSRPMLKSRTKVTPRSIVFLEKLIATHSVKTFPPFYGTLGFITMITRACCQSLF